MILNPFIFCTFYSFNQIACWKQGSTDQNQIVWDQAVWYSPRTGPDQDQQTFENLRPIRAGRSVNPLAGRTSNCNRNQPDLLSIQQLVRPTRVHANWNKLVTYNDEYHRVNWGAWLRWSLTLYCPMRNAGQMTIGKTHPRSYGVWFRQNSKWSELQILKHVIINFSNAQFWSIITVLTGPKLHISRELFTWS